MAFDEMKHHLSALDKHVMAYIDDSLEYVELKGFKASMLMITFMVRSFLMGDYSSAICIIPKHGSSYGYW